MLAQQVARKYARALFLSTCEHGLIDQAYSQFTGLKDLLAKDRSLLTFLVSPRVDESQKQELVRSVFGGRLERLFIEFLLVLVKKRRSAFLPEIVDEFHRLVEFNKGISRITVITAVPLLPEEDGKLLAKLAKRESGKIELEKIVDPTIMGGMIIVMHDQIIDGSVRHGIRHIEEMLEKVKVY
jgi:F-type H+-transporting ATPase subunit delta